MRSRTIHRDTARWAGPEPDRRRPARPGVLPRWCAALAAVALLAAGCVEDDPAAAPAEGGTGRGISEQGAASVAAGRSGPTTGSGGIVLATALRTTASCDALLGELKAAALERVGPWGLGGGGWYGPVTADAERAAGDGATSGSGGVARATAVDMAESSTAGTDRGDAGHSSTTTQEAGVDEADVVKTDGRRLVVVDGQRVQVLDVTGSQPVLERTIELPAEVYGGELFLHGDRALLMTTGWLDVPLREVTAGADDAPAELSMPAGVTTSRVIELDLAAGQVLGSLAIEGGYLSARDVDGTVRVVVSTPAVGLPFVFPGNPGAEEAAEAANRAVIERSTIEQWLPAYRSFDGAGNPTGEGLLVPCEAMHLPAEFAGFGSVSVLTVDLGTGGLALGGSVGVLTDGQTVYASTDRLVVATAEWVDPLVFDSGDEDRIREATDEHSTALHTFDITDPTRASYVASGALAGRLVDQFALDEHGGLLRAATTEGALWGDEPDSESFVTVLRESAGTLELVGRVGGLGRGEQIQSVRFGDDVAYVVTFRQVDPFYVVDLADPAAPRVTGELKIPGFSSYLHPLDADRVVGIGQDATEEGRATGAQLSLFDVSDPTSPQRIAQLGLGADTWSTAGSDHRAFLWWEPERMAVLPVSGAGGFAERGATGEPFEGAVVVRITEAGEVVEVGRLSHPVLDECAEPLRPVPEPATSAGGGDDPVATPDVGSASGRIAPDEPRCWRWQPPILRSLVVGDALYTVSDSGVQANAVGDLALRGHVAFPR